MRSAEALLVGLALALPFAVAQSPSTANSDGYSPQPNLYQTHRDESLGFGIEYPESMVAVPLPPVEKQHAENARTASFTNMPPECFNVSEHVFEAAVPRAKGRKAHFYITRFGLSCFSTEVREQLNKEQFIYPQISCARAGDVWYLNRYAPSGYHIGTHRVYFAAAERANPQSPQGRDWGAEAQFITAESLIMIQIYSDDRDLFNDMLKGQLTIGQDAAPFLPSGFNPEEIHSPDMQLCPYPTRF